MKVFVYGHSSNFLGLEANQLLCSVNISLSAMTADELFHKNRHTLKSHEHNKHRHIETRHFRNSLLSRRSTKYYSTQNCFNFAQTMTVVH